MTAWYLLVPAFLLFLGGSYLSFSDAARRSSWYWSAYMGTGLACSALWVVATRQLDAKKNIYVFSLWWDSLMMLAFYVLPLVALGVRPNTGVMVGGGMVVAGLVVVKVYG